MFARMKLLVLSDLHLEFAPLEMPRDLAFDIAILAGDIGAPGTMAIEWVRANRVLRDKPVLFVAGNHEYYGTCMETMLARMRALTRGSQVTLLEADVAHFGRVRFLGTTLWTDFELPIDTPQGWVSDPRQAMQAAAMGMGDYRRIRTSGSWEGDGAPQRGRVPQGRKGAVIERLLRPQDTLAWHAARRAWLLERLAEPFDGTTVVITHHAPHRASVAPRFAGDLLSPAFASELPAVFFAVPALWVHGHTHACCDYVVHNTRVVCNPRGYVQAGQGESPGFSLHRVIEV